MTEPKVALIIGAGDATGGAIARRFAREGYIACLTRRTAAKLEPLARQIEQSGVPARRSQALNYPAPARKCLGQICHDGNGCAAPRGGFIGAAIVMRMACSHLVK